MARHIEDEVIYYYDSHSTQEDLMGETAFHHALVHYIIEVLNWLFQGQRCAMYGNLNIYQTSDVMEYPVAPDVAVIKGVAYQPTVRSWRVGKSGPAPQVVFEVASDETWKKDLTEKPAKYARMGTQEYFAYDPHEFPLSLSRNRRLFGWRLDPDRQVMVEMSSRPDGSLWSHHLQSWLVPDGTMLRLYDRAGKMRLTGMEAEAQQRQVEAEQRRIEAQRADIEAARARVFSEKLRSLGIDPEQLI
jgi:Uma2 family endonuclease